MSTDDLMPDAAAILHVIANNDRLTDNERWACSRGAMALAEVERLRAEVDAWKQTALEAEAECDKAEAHCARLLAVIEEQNEDRGFLALDARAIAAEVRAEMEKGR